jgi:hypothetical protein
VRGILSRAGFTGIKVDRVTEKVGGGSLDETTELLLQLGPLADLLNTPDDQARRAIRTGVRSALSSFQKSGRVLLDTTAWL